MSQTLAVQLSDELYAAIERQAQSIGTSPADLAATSLQERFGVDEAHAPRGKEPGRRGLERHFGAIDLALPSGADNAGIDADLGREYAASREKG